MKKPAVLMHTFSTTPEKVTMSFPGRDSRGQCHLPCVSCWRTGSGKSLIARVIATEAGAMFYDLSPSVIENIYKHPKTGASLMIHKTFLSAQENAPAVIYIDNVDEVFMPKKAPKKKGSAPETLSTAWRIRDTLKAHLNLVRDGQTRV